MTAVVWFALLIAIAIQLLLPAAPLPAPVTYVRFHHLHFRVPDPAETMKRLGSAVDEPVVIAQGLGVGARSGAEYVMFDRLGDEVPGAIGRSPSDRYQYAVAWLAVHGVGVTSDSQRPAQLAALAGAASFDHLAFATSNLPALSAELSRDGVVVSRTNDISMTVDAGPAGRVEIVSDADLPDMYFCPMHADVRSPTPGSCPLCRMALVPIPPPRIGQYRMDVLPTPAPGGGWSGLRLDIRDPDTDAIVRDFVTVHDKRLHLFIVGRDLDYFAHVHPTQVEDGSYELRQAVPAGEYVVIADFVPAGGTPQTLQRALITPGWDAPMTEVPALSETLQATGDGVRVTLEARDLVVGKDASLRFSVTDVASGEPVTDLQPYLAAPAHLLMASADLTIALHGHPEEVTAGGPVVSFEMAMPAAGPFKIWLQVQRAGRVITLPFVVVVR